ncbi:MAG: oligosaccharide flippase family protein [Clostridia bacterium]|nr:oligosaccharide flippase family protein [Clostridia bacterium]
MNKLTKLLKNSGLFAISTFGSKILSFLMVPVYSYVLSTAEFGTADIYMTVLNLLVPIVSLSIFDAIFRYAINNTKENSVEYFETGITFSFIASAVFIILGVIFTFVFKQSIVNNVVLIATVIFQVFLSALQQFAKAVNRVSAFSVSAILYTLSYLLGNILFLVVFRFGITGYLVSYMLAGVISVSYLCLAILPQEFKGIRFTFTLKRLKEMLGYCVPLIPNAVLLWIITASNRFFLLHYCGVESNGIYAVANKIPLVLSLFTSVFFQAWQISAIDETKEKNNDFSARIINGLVSMSAIGSSAILLLSKFVVDNFFNEQYATSSEYIPFLLLGVVFQCFASFYGTIYIAYKKTTAVMTTSAVAAIISVIGNVVLMPKYGVQAACFTTMISFFVMWIIRMVHTRKIYHVRVNLPLLIVSCLLICIQAVLRITVASELLQILCSFATVAIVLFFNRELFSQLFKKRKGEANENN